jgi:hypothetical protein
MDGVGTLGWWVGEATVSRAVGNGSETDVERKYGAPCVVLIINYNPYGLIVALSYRCRTWP